MCGCPRSLLIVLSLHPVLFQSVASSRIQAGSLVDLYFDNPDELLKAEDSSHFGGQASAGVDEKMDHLARNATQPVAERSARQPSLSAHSPGQANHYFSLVQEPAAKNWKGRILAIGFGLFALTFVVMIFVVVQAFFKQKPAGRTPYSHLGQVIYEWDQTPQMANLYIKPPPGLQKSDFEITIHPHKLKVGRQGKAPFLSERFFGQVDLSTSGWTLDDSGEIHVHLHKAESAEWTTILQHTKDVGEAASSITDRFCWTS